MQTAWNLLVRGIETLTDGLDRIPEAIAAQVPLLANAGVHGVGIESGSGHRLTFWGKKACHGFSADLVPMAVIDEFPNGNRTKAEAFG